MNKAATKAPAIMRPKTNPPLFAGRRELLALNVRAGGGALDRRAGRPRWTGVWR
jgi:hypothetical protein